MACTGGMATTVRRRVARRAAVQRPPPRRVCACQAPPAPVSPARPRGAGGSNAGCARLLRTIEWVGGGGWSASGWRTRRARTASSSRVHQWNGTSHTHTGGGGRKARSRQPSSRVGWGSPTDAVVVGEARVGGLCCARLGASVQTAVVGGGVNPQPPDRPPHLLFLSLKPVEPLPPPPAAHRPRPAGPWTVPGGGASPT